VFNFIVVKIPICYIHKSEKELYSNIESNENNKKEKT